MRRTALHRSGASTRGAAVGFAGAVQGAASVLALATAALGAFVALTAASPALGGGELHAQSADPVASARADALPAWMTDWGPLAPADHRLRTLPAAPAAPGLLASPMPRVGRLWTAGDPAGLAFDVDDARGELRVRGAGEDGGYRRALDPEGVDVVQLSGLRWQPLGENGAVIGRVVSDVTTTETSPLSPAAIRFDGDPFVVTDTLVAPMRHVRVRIEGAYGWRWGEWGAGLGAGLGVTDLRTREERLPRLTSESTPGLSAGVARRLLDGRLELSAYGRWTGGAEGIRLIAGPPVDGIVFQLDGYGDPEPVVFNNRVFTHYVQRDRRAGGLAAAGTVFDAEWAAFAERTRTEHEHTQRRRRNETPDVWRADGWRAGAAAVSTFVDGRLRAMASASFRTQDGEAFRSDLDGVIFRAHRSTLDAAVELRWTPPESPWFVGGRARVRREVDEHDDFLTRIGIGITAWRPGGSLEVGKRLGDGTVVSGHAGVGWHSAFSRLPVPDAMGPVYRRVLAPELAAYAAAVGVYRAGASVRHRMGDRVAFLLRGGAAGLSAAENRAGVPMVPDGGRGRWDLSLTAVWEPEPLP